MPVYEKLIVRDRPVHYWTLLDASTTVATDVVGAARGTYVKRPR